MNRKVPFVPVSEIFFRVFVKSGENEFGNYAKGLFIWAEVISVPEKTFRQVHKRDLALI